MGKKINIYKLMQCQVENICGSIVKVFHSTNVLLQASQLLLAKIGQTDNRQYGKPVQFKPNIYTMEPAIIQDAVLSRKMCVALFLDIKKAYDMIWRKNYMIWK